MPSRKRPAEPTNKKLYEQVKREAKKKYGKWSAYASSWTVREYKKRGGRYRGSKPRTSSITRWHKEKWVNVCKRTKSGRYAPCGRKRGSTRARDYPYCRPMRRVSSQTPKTVRELGPKKLRQMCSKKRKSMRKSRGQQTRVRLSSRRRTRRTRRKTKRRTRRRTRRKTKRKTRRKTKRKTRRKTRSRKR